MKPINHNVKRWLIIAGICIAVILLLSVAFRGCLRINPHNEEKKGIEQVNKALQQGYDSLLLVQTASAVREDSLQQVTVRQGKQLKAANRELDQTRLRILVIAHALDSAKSNKDTVRFMALADSLKKESVSQQQVIVQQQQVTDSTIQNYERRLDEKDKVIEAQAKFISQMRTAHIDLNEKYNSLHKDYGKVTRKLKGERTLGRVLAGALLVAGGLFIAK